MTEESKEQQAKMNPESESTYFCQIWTPPYSLIICNPAGNPSPTDIVIKVLEKHLRRKGKKLCYGGQTEW
jgi:hypothetical protein